MFTKTFIGIKNGIKIVLKMAFIFLKQNIKKQNEKITF